METIVTWQEWQQAGGSGSFILDAIRRHKASEMYKVACDANLYDKQRNRTINEYVQNIFSLTGTPVEDFTASNNKIASNFFYRLNTQRCMYSLGNGVNFAGRDQEGDRTKELLGARFDHDLREWAYAALIHGVAFGFWDVDRLYTFDVTEFVPVWDEVTGALRAGIRFWRLTPDKPMSVVTYEEDGITTYRTKSVATKNGTKSEVLELLDEKRGYIQQVAYTVADGKRIIGEDNWATIPVIAMYGSRLRQSTLIGIREQIDSFDLIQSGFANDLTDVSQIYWIIENFGGMTDADLERFRDRLRITHIAPVETDQGGKVTPYTQEIPYSARQAYLESIEHRIYKDFGALDVTALSGGTKTATEIDAAYQPLDENASDFEHQVRDAIQQLLELLGIDDTPVFKRQRITNQLEAVQMLSIEAAWLDRETILAKLPNVTPDEAQQILERKDSEEMSAFGTTAAQEQQAEPEAEAE